MSVIHLWAPVIWRPTSELEPRLDTPPADHEGFSNLELENLRTCHNIAAKTCCDTVAPGDERRVGKGSRCAAAGRNVQDSRGNSAKTESTKFQDLPKIESFKTRFTREKATVDAQLRAGIRAQLEITQVTWLHQVF